MYFRTYLSKNNTLINNSEVNTGRNEVTELVYGNIPIISSSGDTIFTRYIFRLDLESLTNYINKFNLDLSLLTHKLRLYNTIKLQPEKINEKLYDFNDRAFGVRLNLYKIDDDFTEGIGHTFLYRNTLNFITIGESESIQPSNYYNNRLGEFWSNEGAITHTGSTLVASQYFEFGNEDFYVDFTNEINSQISGNTTGTTSGSTYVLTYEPDIESLDDVKLNKIHFFSKYTNTFFEPHLESFTTSSLNCDNSFIDIGRDNSICFKSLCQPTGITVYDECDDYFAENITGITSLGNDFYSFDLTIPNTVPDFVNYLFEVNCASGDTFDFELTTRKLSNKPTKSTESTFNIRLSGIFEGEKIKRGNVRKLKFIVNSIIPNVLPKKIQYRIFVKQGQTNIDIFDWKDVNFFDGEYFDYLDTSWMLPKEYYVEMKVVDGFYDKSNTTLARFFIIDENENIFF